MGRDSIFFGRNPLKEAVYSKVNIKRLYFKGPGDEDFAKSLLKNSRVPFQKGLPSFLESEPHQGIAFEVDHNFYLDEADKQSLQKHSRILLCNHLQDVQNLGALSRSAAAFGFSLVVHEKRRSFRLNPAAVKVSMGLSFRLKYLEVANLLGVCEKLRRLDYIICGMEADSAINLFEWRAVEPLALVMGSESEGLSRPLQKALDYKLKIPMAEGVDSLNVAQAGSLAMAWIHHSLS